MPQAAWLLVASFLLQYLIAVALHDFRGFLKLTPAQASALVMLLAHGTVLATVLHVKGMGYRELLHPTRASVGATAFLLVPPVILLLPLLLLVASGVHVLLLQLFPMSRWEEQLFASFHGGGLATVIAICVLAPVCEEMLFRGVILRGFLTHYPRRKAIVASALFFGVAHLNLYQFVVAWGLGLVLGWLYERSRSLVPCIALHAGYNTLVVVAGAVASGPELPGAGEPLVWVGAVVAGVAGAATLIRLLAFRPAAGHNAAPATADTGARIDP